MGKLNKKPNVYGYICATDWSHEFGGASCSHKIYANLADLFKDDHCAVRCGIMRVKIETDKLILDHDMGEKTPKELRLKEAKEKDAET